MKISKRIIFIDICKALLILLVVLGHCNISSLSSHLINSFDMPAFFFLSGLTLNCDRSIKEFAKRKWCGVLLPYLIFCMIFLLFQFLKTFIVKENSFDLTSGLLSIIIPVSGRRTTTVYCLWFLPCLLLTEMIYFIIYKLWNNRKLSTRFIAVIILAGFLGGSIFITSTSILSIFPISFLFLSIGFFLKNKLEKIEIIKTKWKVIALIACSLLFVIFSFLNYKLYGNSVDLSSMTLNSPILYLFSSFFGTIALVFLSMFIPNSFLIRKVGQGTLYIYGLHFEILSVISFLSKNWIIQFILTFILAVLVTLIILQLKEIKFKRSVQREVHKI